uniref:Uncharacterized protein n=1 Tax=Tetranychus urticae TaxID=32264 RepID=T1KBC5_TETUR
MNLFLIYCPSSESAKKLLNSIITQTAISYKIT